MAAENTGEPGESREFYGTEAPVSRPAREQDRDGGGDPVAAFVAALARVGLVLAGGWFIYLAVEMTPRIDSAIHEIYQLNAAASGLIMWGIAGMWGAIDARRRR